MSNSFPNSNWMAASPAIDHLSLLQLSLPGTHNAGSDWKASYALIPGKNLLACQRDSFLAQLNHGSRALDLRLACKSKEKDITRYRFRHNSFLSSRTLHDLVRDLEAFLQASPDEFVILDFHELADSEGPFDFREFNAHIMGYLGPRIIPAKHAHLSLGELKRISSKQRILVAATSHEELDEQLFCSKIQHKWEEASSTTAAKLRGFIERVVANPPSSWAPWSLSAATFFGPFGPTNLHEELDVWFNPEKSNWASRCNIINVDFIEESKIVSYCRMANLAKAAK
jgi:1-phosphatidylinositol phosphodiesterase